MDDAQNQTRLLLIDDDRNEAKLFGLHLIRFQHVSARFDVALSSKDVAAMDSLADYDLIFLDHRFPPLNDSRSMVPVLREKGYEGPVIVVTAAIDDELMRDAEDFGIAACVDKLSMTPSMLEAMIADHVPQAN